MTIREILFHPLQLVSGGYFSGNDLMKDSIILDEDAGQCFIGNINYRLLKSRALGKPALLPPDYPGDIIFAGGCPKRRER